MLKKQYQLLLVTTLFIASTSQILARTLDIPPSKDPSSNSQQFLKTTEPLSVHSVKNIKKENLPPPAQNSRQENITKKTLAPHLSFSASKIGKATTTFGGTTTVCSSRNKPTICLFGKPAPTKCGAIVVPTTCDGLNASTWCFSFDFVPTECPTGTHATECPNEVMPTVCSSSTGTVPTRCEQTDEFIPTECPTGTYATECLDGVTATVCSAEHNSGGPVLTPTYCEHSITYTECAEGTFPTYCYSLTGETQLTHCREGTFPTHCANDLVYPTVCKNEGGDKLTPTKCPNGVVIATNCPGGKFQPTYCQSPSIGITRCPGRNCSAP